jgi:hypothetical protein
MFTLRELNKQWTASLLGLSLFGFLCLNVTAQTPTQSVPDDGPTQVTFHLAFMVRNAPVKITHVMLGDKEVPLDTPVPVSGMWVRNLSVVVQNISPKVIVQGGIILTYPETGDGSSSKPTLSTILSLGRYPPHAFIQRDGTDKAITGRPLPPEIKVLPGSSMTFKIENYPDLDQIKAQEIIGHPLTKLNIQFPASYYFEDGSIWRGSSYYVPVPPPVVWREITDTEFFGGAPPGHQ